MMLGMILLSVSASLIDIVFPKFQEYAINHYIGEGTLDTIRTFTVLYTALLLIKIAMDLGSTYLGNRVEMYMGRDLKQKSFDHLQTLSFSYFNQNSVGYIHSRVMSDTGRIGSLVSWSFLDCNKRNERKYDERQLYVCFEHYDKRAYHVRAVPEAVEE